MTKTPLRVLIVEDHALVRAGLAALLEQLGITVSGESATGEDLLALYDDLAPDVVLMDIVLQAASGLDLTARLLAAHPDARVLIVSLYANEEYLRRAFDLGARGYVLKDSAPDELERALRTVGAGGSYMSNTVARRLAGAAGVVATRDDRLTLLTPRQREVLTLIAQGHSTKDAARLLGVSVKTVETHRTQLMKRLDMHDIPSLVRLAIRAGLVSLED